MPAIRMMSSDQLNAFDVSQVSESERSQFGDTPFGRGCLAALRLIETGVRCVEVTLTGWDSHVNNHEIQAGRISILDPAYASLIKELKKRDLLDSTMVVCGGEFGKNTLDQSAGAAAIIGLMALVLRWREVGFRVDAWLVRPILIQPRGCGA